MSLADELATLDLFAGLTPDQRRELAGRMSHWTVPKGRIVVGCGDEQNSRFYLIRRGRVKVTGCLPDGGEALLAFLGAGEFFGELSLLDGEPRSASVVAAKTCELLVLDRADFRRFVLDTPSAALAMLEVLSRRIRLLNLRMENRRLPVRDRIARELTALSGAGQAGADGTIRIATGLSQAELAGLWGVSRPQLNRQLAALCDEGLIRLKGKGEIILLDLGRLAAILEEDET